MIAHEVNQPLAAVVTPRRKLACAGSVGTPDIEGTLAVLRQIVNNARRASGVIRKIREFSKKVDPEVVQLDINEVVEEAIALVRQEAAGNH